MSNRKILPSFIICLLAQSAGGAFAQDVPKPLAKLGGYQLVFHDDFDNLDLSPDSHGKHVWYEGVWFNKHHVPLSSISASGGMLTLTWNRGQDQVDTSITTLSHDTKNFRAWKYGYFEARMKWDQVNGAWPAFWLIPVQDANRTDLYNGVRESGEVDILEGQGDHPHNRAVPHLWAVMDAGETGVVLRRQRGAFGKRRTNFRSAGLLHGHQHAGGVALEIGRFKRCDGDQYEFDGGLGAGLAAEVNCFTLTEPGSERRRLLRAPAGR
jgi:hypothetical protein